MGLLETLLEVVEEEEEKKRQRHGLIQHLLTLYEYKQYPSLVVYMKIAVVCPQEICSQVMDGWVDMLMSAWNGTGAMTREFVGQAPPPRGWRHH